ncbi:MAG: bifunctional protein-serine/threonine kinase/phosphatase [Sphingomicrobium sp.]
MRSEATLEIAAGFASATGRRPDNQDFGGVHIGPPAEQAMHGIIAAVADGVGGSAGGREAAELAVRTFIDGYPAQSPTLGVAEGALRTLKAYNRWLHAIGRGGEAMRGAACTFTALIMRGREASVVHVGDTRAWLLRGSELRLLTEDHVLAHPDMRHVLYRALGVDPDLRADTFVVALEPHDRLLVTSDGVHGSLNARAIQRLLAARGSAQADAEALVAAALAADSQDNVTALVIDVVAVPALDQQSIASVADRLPQIPPPRAGDHIDGIRLDRLLSDGRYSRSFVATEGETSIVLKFPKPAALSADGARGSFLREQLIGQVIDSPFVGRSLPLDPAKQSCLYIKQPFHDGETLEARIASRRPGISAAIAIAIKLARAVAALHRSSVIHRDIKPDNVMLLERGGLKLIDLGVARLPHVPEFSEQETPGTPSYMAPEMFDGERGDEATDQFALGVTVYRMLTGRYPYGEVEAFSRPRFGVAAPPSRGRPEIPAWLDAVVMKAVAIDPTSRFNDVIELIQALESGSARAAPIRAPVPLIERNPVLFWQLLSLLLGIALVVAIALE